MNLTCQFQCVIECVFNRSGFNNNSKLNRDEVLKVFLNRTKNDTAWNPLITKAVDTCFTDRKNSNFKLFLVKFSVIILLSSSYLVSNEAFEEFVATYSNETSSLKNPSYKMCHPLSAFTLDCIYMELFKICPQQKFNQTMPGCISLKTHAANCDDW